MPIIDRHAVGKRCDYKAPKRMLERSGRTSRLVLLLLVTKDPQLGYAEVPDECKDDRERKSYKVIYVEDRHEKLHRNKTNDHAHADRDIKLEKLAKSHLVFLFECPDPVKHKAADGSPKE